MPSGRLARAWGFRCWRWRSETFSTVRRSTESNKANDPRGGGGGERKQSEANDSADICGSVQVDDSSLDGSLQYGKGYLILPISDQTKGRTGSSCKRPLGYGDRLPTARVPSLVAAIFMKIPRIGL